MQVQTLSLNVQNREKTAGLSRDGGDFMKSQSSLVSPSCCIPSVPCTCCIITCCLADALKYVLALHFAFRKCSFHFCMCSPCHLTMLTHPPNLFQAVFLPWSHPTMSTVVCSSPFCSVFVFSFTGKMNLSKGKVNPQRWLTAGMHTERVHSGRQVHKDAAKDWIYIA